MSKFALIGGKLGHSYSPMIHSKFGDYQYDLCEVEPQDLESLLHSGIYDGFNVTIPYKQTVMQYCDEISDTGRRIGAVNTVVRDSQGKLTGYNTDYDGVRYMLEANQIQVGGRKCIVLGSGGTSHTVRTVLEDLGAREITIVSRSGEDNYHNLEKHHDAQIIVNTTPVGMYPNNLVSLVDLDQFRDLKGVVDVIYNPNRTKIVLDAMARGIPATGGLEMLVAQGWRASELFQGKDLNPEEIPAAYEEVQDAMLNKILIGMPGSGKTLLGKKMAERLSREFVDMDDLIMEREGRSIPEIFAQEGEDYFRKVETELLRETCMRRGLVIATGGGIVKRQENYDIIRQNGTVIWIQRNLDKLETDGRPLSMSTPVEILYQERKAAYEAWSDFLIDNNQDMK